MKWENYDKNEKNSFASWFFTYEKEIWEIYDCL